MKKNSFAFQGNCINYILHSVMKGGINLNTWVDKMGKFKVLSKPAKLLSLFYKAVTSTGLLVLYYFLINISFDKKKYWRLS